MPSEAGAEGFYERLIALDASGCAAALSAADIGVVWVDFVEGVLRCNDVLAELMGVAVDEPLPLDVLTERFLHPADVDETVTSLRANVTQREAFVVDQRWLRADGRYVPCRIFVLPVFEDDRVVRLVGIVRNQDELDRLRNQMRHAESLAGIGYWRVDAQGTLWWSDGAYRIYGFEPGSVEPTLELARSFYPEQERERLADVFSELLTSAGPIDVRTVIETASGERRHIKVIGQVERNADGDVVNYGGVIQDITEELDREERIRQSQKMEAIGKLTGGAAHDFNNLLAVILGNLELLRDRVDSSELVEYCETAIEATLNGADLTKSMLSFARQAQLNPVIVDLNTVVRGLDRWTRRTLPATINVEVSLMAGLWPTEVDIPSAESALLNLILNARDAMSAGGSLTIETSNVRIEQEYIESRREDVGPGRYVMVAVSDTGVGIESDVMGRIFEPFFTTKEIGEGTGLGLSMVQGFVKQSGGVVRVYSEPGVGTTVKLYFPARTDGAVPADPPAAAARRRRTGTARILVAEDEEHVLSILVETLELEGYDVVAARSGDEAKRLFEADSDFDLLLTDIVMPGELQGTALARHLREAKPTLLTVFMSGYANEATVHGNGLRPEDIRLMKPVRRVDLLDAIARALSRATPDA